MFLVHAMDQMKAKARPRVPDVVASTDVVVQLETSLETVVGRVSTFPIAGRVLEHASRGEQQKLLEGLNVTLPIVGTKNLGHAIERCCERHGGPIGMWHCLHGGTAEQAALELAVTFDLIHDFEYRSLLRGLGLDDRLQRLLTRPWFDEQRGELWYGKELVRRVDTARSDNTLQILRAFQKANWPASIEGLREKEWSDQQRLDAVRRLNQGLSHISFHTKGTTIFWRISPSEPEPTVH